MDEILLIEAVERYMKGEMSPREKTFFEELRKNNAELDQMVVEQTLLFHELDRHAAIKDFKHAVHEVEQKLAEEGIITRSQLKGKAKLVYIWKRYKRNIAVAASIAGLVSLFTTGIVMSYNKKVADDQIIDLIDELKDTQKDIDTTKAKVEKLEQDNNIVPILPAPNADYRATGFLIDGRGYLVTNAHVVSRMKTIHVKNIKGEYFSAVAVYSDKVADLAILKITGSNFKPMGPLPYSIKKTNTNPGAQIFTLGYPRNDIVYGEGYLSARSGNDGDSTAYQLSVSVNPGNSGGPVMNRNGEIIGIITSKNASADGVVFAAKSKNIYKLLESLKKDGDTQKIQLPNSFGLRGMDRERQVEKMEEFVFMVMGTK